MLNIFSFYNFPVQFNLPAFLAEYKSENFVKFILSSEKTIYGGLLCVKVLLTFS